MKVGSTCRRIHVGLSLHNYTSVDYHLESTLGLKRFSVFGGVWRGLELLSDGLLSPGHGTGTQ